MYNMLKQLRIVFEKFDAAGETLLTLNKISKYKRKTFINNFFINLLIWGSYKIGNLYATDKSIIYRAVSVNIN